MTGPRYALRETVRIGWQLAEIRGRTFAEPMLYDVLVAGELRKYVEEGQIEPLVKDDESL